jgi:phosphomevalonate kinase
VTTLCSAPGKLVLLGEYVVLEGAPAVVAAMDRRAEVRADPAGGFAVSIPAMQIFAAPYRFDDGKLVFTQAGMHNDPRLGYFCSLSQAIYAAAAARGGSLKPCTLTLDTQQFFLPNSCGSARDKLGLGSSAALCVALLAAYFAEAGLLEGFTPLDDPAQQGRLLHLAHQVHCQAQSSQGSGVDIAASIYGGVLRFENKPEQQGMLAHRLPLLPQVTLLPVWSGASASTRDMLQQVRAFKVAQPQIYWEYFEKLGVYAQAGAEFWALRNVAALGTVIDAYHTTLAALGEACHVPIVTPEHATLHRLASACGAFYKSSGAGGGDLGVALCPDAQVAARLSAKLLSKKFQGVPMQIDPRGLEVRI